MCVCVCVHFCISHVLLALQSLPKGQTYNLIRRSACRWISEPRVGGKEHRGYGAHDNKSGAALMMWTADSPLVRTWIILYIETDNWTE